MADQKLTALSTVANPALTDIFYIVQGSTSYQVPIGNLRSLLNPYDIDGSALTKPTSGDTLMRFIANRDFTVASSLASSIGGATVSAAVTTVFEIQHNGSSWATMTFNASSISAVFSGPAKTFAKGDMLAVYISTADANLDGLAWTIAGKLS